MIKKNKVEEQQPNVSQEDADEIDQKVIDQNHDEFKVMIKQKEDQIAEFKNLYLRALADYKNLDQRVRSERAQMRDRMKMEFLMDMFPVLDTMEKAQIFTTDPGLKMVGDSFLKSFADMGVLEVTLLGSKYDPHTSEVIEVVDGEEDNVVVEVLQKAYEYSGQVIRPGKVKVSKKIK